MATDYYHISLSTDVTGMKAQQRLKMGTLSELLLQSGLTRKNSAKTASFILIRRRLFLGRA